MPHHLVKGVQARLFTRRDSNDVELLREVTEWVAAKNPLIEDMCYYCDEGGVHITLYYTLLPGPCGEEDAD